MKKTASFGTNIVFLVVYTGVHSNDTMFSSLEALRGNCYCDTNQTELNSSSYLLIALRETKGFNTFLRPLRVHIVGWE